MALAPELLAAAPGIARRLGGILAALAALIAHAFLRNPRRVGIIIPLWTRINRTAARFARLMARLPNATAARSRQPPRPGRPGGAPPASLPSTHGWLVAELGYPAAGYGGQLNHLLSEPETVALLARIPQAGRILRPICRMLGIRPACLPPAPSRTRAAPAARLRPDVGSRPHAEAKPRPASLAHDHSRDTPPPPLRATLPLCPRLRDRWPWNTLPLADTD
jgi:hypothetical protein